MSEQNDDWDVVHDTFQIRVVGFPDEQLMGLEIHTVKGEKVLVAMSGEGLIGLGEQISGQIERTPEIASWKSRPRH